MTDVKIIFTDQNLRFQIINAYNGSVLHTSGKYKSYKNAQKGVTALIEAHDEWRLVDDNNVVVVHK